MALANSNLTGALIPERDQERTRQRALLTVSTSSLYDSIVTSLVRAAHPARAPDAGNKTPEPGCSTAGWGAAMAIVVRRNRTQRGVLARYRYPERGLTCPLVGWGCLKSGC